MDTDNNDHDVSIIERIIHDEEMRNNNANNGRQMTPDDIIDKILGIVYGCAIGEHFGHTKKDPTESEYTYDDLNNTMQLCALMDAYSKFSGFNMEEYSSFLQHTETSDEYMKSITSDDTFIHDPIDVSIKSFSEYSKKGSHLTCTNVPLIRSLLMGIFEKWEDLSVLHCAHTHPDHRCLSASMMLSSFIRSMILGRETDISETIPETINLILFGKKISDENHIRDYVLYSSPDISNTIKKIGLDTDGDYVYKCMAVAIWGLDQIVYRTKDKDIYSPSEFYNIMTTITEEGGCVTTNCAVTGALIGCEIGYTNLLNEHIDVVCKFKRINDSVISFLKKLELVDDDVKDVCDIIKTPAIYRTNTLSYYSDCDDESIDCASDLADGNSSEDTFTSSISWSTEDPDNPKRSNDGDEGFDIIDDFTPPPINNDTHQ